MVILNGKGVWEVYRFWNPDFGFIKNQEEAAKRKLMGRINEAGVRGIDGNGRKYKD